MALLSWLDWVGAATCLGLLQWWIVALHPEPAADEPDAGQKPRYADLARPVPIATTLLLIVACGWLVAGLPAPVRPAWLVWASAGLVLVWVDARTTWLPLRASNFTAGALAAAIVIGPAFAGVGWAPVVRAGLGAVITGGLFALFWWFSRALGFGDVRLAAMLGGLTALSSAQLWYLAILLGSLVAAGWGLVTSWWRRSHPSPLGKAFPYGPGLWLGPWLGLIWLGAG